MRSLEEPEPRPTATPCGCAKPALETGNVLTDPIGYLESCFTAKNGTPRQPSICSRSRACLRIRKSIFNNPEHALMGLEQFSHVWILFVFHKNGHLSYKAKVQPPRLNGAKTGVFSTRSPHRPNAIGLTLAKLERVEGGAIYLSGIDMIHGTPVLDIKPYIVDYDSPQDLEPSNDFNLQNGPYKQGAVPHSEGRTSSCDPQQLSACAIPQPWPSTEKPRCPENQASEEKELRPCGTCRTQRASPENTQRAADLGQESGSREETVAAEEQHGPPDPKGFLAEVTHRKPSVEDTSALRGSSTETQPASSCPARTARVPHSVVPAWVKEAPVAPLQVRFTPHAEMDLEHLSSGDAGQASFKYFRSAEEAKCAIEAVLSADPRSVYRRKLCGDRLFYFTVDRVHVTCWFGDGFAEVLRIKLAAEPVQMPDHEEPLVSLDLREPLSLRQPP